MIPTPDARASSFSTVATPPRVASRIVRSSSPAASSSASATGHSERVSDSISASRPSSPRASMIAVPCSPIVRETSTRSPGSSAAGESRARESTQPDPGRGHVHAVGVPALDHLRVAGDDLDPGGRARSRRSPRPRPAARSASRPSSSTSARLIASGGRPGRAEVVDGPVDRQLADRAAGEAQRLDHVGVGGQREAGPVRRHPPRVGELVERLGCERRRQQPLDQRLGRLAAGPVRHRDPLVLEPRALRARRLDDLEDSLLAAGGRRLRGHATASAPRSRA